MNKVELNKYIESICKQIPIVHSFYTDDVYEVWATDDIQYGSVSFVVTNSSISDNVTNWTGVIYYADRLLEDKSNRDSVQTDANNVINAIMNAISMDDDIITINYPTEVTFFEQRFVDLLAGGYASIQIGTDNSISKCGYGFVKEQEGCAGKIAELEDEIEVLEEKNDRLSDLLGTANEALDQAQNNLTECRASNESLIESNQQLETENDRLESEVGRLEDEVDDLNSTIEDLRKGGIDFSSIGYDKDDSTNANEQFNYDLRRSQELLDYWNAGNRNTTGFRDIVYAPMWDMVSKWGPIKSTTFSGCKLLRYVPMYDMSTSTNTMMMFYNCSSLTSIPLLDTHNVTTMASMFNGCGLLTTIPQLNTSNVTTMASMFANCSSLTSIPLLDTHNVTTMNYMFQYCSSLTSIPLLDTSNVTNMGSMFYNCSELITIPQLDTSNAKAAESMFYSCSKLESLPLLNFSSVTSISSFFGWSNINTLTDMGGFTGLKVDFDGLSRCPNLTVQSLLNVFNTIADLNELGISSKTLTIGTTNLNKLTDDQKAIATTKGWTLK